MTKTKIVLSGLLILMLFAVAISAQVDDIYGIERAYAYRDEALLIGKSDLYGSYFIRDRFPKEVSILTSFDSIVRNQLSTNDRLIIDKGGNAGLREGDRFLVIGEGPVVNSPINGMRLGRHYQKKAVAVVDCVYEESSVIVLSECYFPVTPDDFLVPLVEEETVFKKKIDFSRCRLPESDVLGRIVYMEKVISYASDFTGSNELVTVDLGRAMVGKGDFLLFYRQIKKNLPPLVIGSGIVVHSENNNSTVRVIEIADVLQHGDYVVALPPAQEIDRVPDSDAVLPGEKLPIVDFLSMDEIQENLLTTDILFNLDSSSVNEIDLPMLQQVRDFINGKEDFLVILRGYSCAIGSEEYNLRLSQERVEKIKALLIEEHSIPEQAIETYFYGESESLFDNSAEQERKKNRLVRIEVIAK